MFIKGYFLDHSLEQLNEYITEYNFNIFYNCHSWGETRKNWLGDSLIMTGPYDLPLWFLRELIFMTVLTPIIYFLTRKLNSYFIAILFIAYISKVWVLIPGLDIEACFFFSLGAYFSLNNISIISLVNKYKYIILPLSVILLFVSIIYDGSNTVIGKNIYPIFIITTVLAVFYLTSIIVKKYNIKPNKLLVSSCFFIYAFHAIFLYGIGSPLGICKKILNYIIPELYITKYLMTPFLTAILGIIIMQIGKKLLPDITKWYTGNR